MQQKKRPKPVAEKNKIPEAELTSRKGSLKKLSNAMAIFCALLGFLLYANTLGHTYTVDDDTVMKKNKIVTKGVSAIPEIFVTPYRKGFWDRSESLYRPLSLVMFAIEWQVAPEKPFTGHLMNVLLYALTGFVLFVTLRTMLRKFNLLIPFLATVLFIAHPLHTEVVANIKSRDELLSFLFLISSLYFLFSYLKTEKRKVTGIVLSVACFLLALLSKESAITFIVIVPLTLYFFTDLKTKSVLQCTAWFLIPLAVYFGMRLNALQGINTFTEILPINNSLVTAPNAASRLATAIAILGKYFMLLVFPHPLSFDYSFNQIPNISFGDAKALLSVLLYIGLIVYALRSFKKKNILSFTIIYFIITVSLVSNLVITIESTMAERFLYTSSLAFCIALPVLLAKLFKIDLQKTNFYSWKTFFSTNKTIPLLAIIILVLYSVKTIARNGDWKDNYTLLKKDVVNAPNSARVRYAYGSELYFNHVRDEKNETKKIAALRESLTQLEKGVEILPTYADAFYQLGLAYTEANDYPNAVRAFESAKRSKEWKEAEFFQSSGLAYGLAKQYDKAFIDLREAIALNPKMKEAYNNWGLYLTEAGNVKDALVKLDSAILLDPKLVSAWYNKGNAFAQGGDYKQAITCYEKALSFDPTYTDAITNIGNCYATMNDIPQAITYYEKVLAIDPSNVKAIQNLAVSYKKMGNEAKSLEYQRKIAPGN